MNYAIELVFDDESQKIINELRTKFKELFKGIELLFDVLYKKLKDVQERLNHLSIIIKKLLIFFIILV